MLALIWGKTPMHPGMPSEDLLVSRTRPIWPSITGRLATWANRPCEMTMNLWET